jgi:hypothetical protein
VSGGPSPPAPPCSDASSEVTPSGTTKVTGLVLGFAKTQSTSSPLLVHSFGNCVAWADVGSAASPVAISNPHIGARK